MSSVLVFFALVVRSTLTRRRFAVMHSGYEVWPTPTAASVATMLSFVPVVVAEDDEHDLPLWT